VKTVVRRLLETLVFASLMMTGHASRSLTRQWERDVYTAPELEDGRADDVTPAADVYSLGKILYWLMAGHVFDREKHRLERFDLTQDQKDPTMFWVYELLDKMIVENPSKRLPDAAATQS